MKKKEITIIADEVETKVNYNNKLELEVAVDDIDDAFDAVAEEVGTQKIIDVFMEKGKSHLCHEEEDSILEEIGVERIKEYLENKEAA